MKRSLLWLIVAIGCATLLGAGTRSRWFTAPLALAQAADPSGSSARSGIDKLHELDRRVTLLNDPKALQAEWSSDAVRIEPDYPPDVGKAAIYASDFRSFTEAPGGAIVSYHPEIRDVQVFGDRAVEWGTFDVGYRAAPGKPVELFRGKLLRVLRREASGDWKFSHVMVVFDSKPRGGIGATKSSG
jgi:ketosteroid isomerase-like protein